MTTAARAKPYRRKPAALAVGLLLCVSANSPAQPLATIEPGALAGIEAAGIRAFLGIPYAEPPVGELRWRPPQRAAPWTGPRKAVQFGAACPQPDDKLYGLTPPVQDEACLFLNVWAPAGAAEPLPVMVWLHGGANRMGAGSIPTYNGANLAKRGAVVVTLNYRLGYLGFFAHEALDGEQAGGNFGLMDQVQALQWVKRNIAAFGGDPDRVTVFGESAGGADILYLMTSPLGAGLLERAIVQSGGGWNNPPAAEHMRQAIAEDFSAADIPAGADAKALRDLPARKLVEAQVTTPMGFGPFLDGVTTREKPWAAFEAGRAATAPLIIGSNTWEGNLLKLRGLSFKAKLTTFLPSVFAWYGDVADSADERGTLLFRDAAFAAPARAVAAAHSNKAPAWLYVFGHVTQGRRGQVPGAGHAAEIAYVFDNLTVFPKLAALASPKDRELAGALADCWVAFARGGAPACALADWKRYAPADDNILWIEDGARAIPHPHGEILDGVRRKFGPGSLLGS